jgi:hypothetical protein
LVWLVAAQQFAMCGGPVVLDAVISSIAGLEAAMNQ